MSAAADATIVIVSFHSAGVIADCLAAAPQGVRVLVIDNGSRDDSVALARAARPDAEIIALDSNQGFGRASNIGLRLVETPYAFLLNPDCVLSPGALDDLVEAARAHPEMAILGPAGHGGESASGEIRVEAVTEIVGAGMLLRMDLFRRIGFFDEKLFLFGEDNEICARARSAGARIGIVHGVSMRHLVARSADVEGYSPRVRERLIGQSAAYVRIKRHGPLLGRVLCWRKIGVYLIKASQAVLAGRDGESGLLIAKARGTFDFLLGGEPILFKNDLALRPREAASDPSAMMGATTPWR